MSFVQIRDLSAGYSGKTILNNISFSMESGEIVGVLGANGSGKTTLLKAVCGILPHRGQCTVDGATLEGLPPKKLGRLCGYIPQRSGISIDISVLDVVLMGFNPMLGLLEHPTAAMKKRAAAMLAETGLAGKENENYLQLSEGQKQLCVLARALVSDGKLLLLDEPESALDFRHRRTAFDLLKRQTAEKNRTVLVTLHDPNLALNRCDRLILLCEGRISAILSPGSDSEKHMADELSKIYGPVSLHRVKDGRGHDRLVMIGEDNYD
ncbi:MAG: ABC transporter ATP-binding protein [Clostridia bacterium]|nr:ABC transporter ATP-binding protein [Clostridia bacterium]